MSWLRLWEFVFALPLESMSKSALRGDQSYRRWSERDYLLNRQLDMTTMLVQLTWAAHGFSGKAPRGPLVKDPELRTDAELRAEQEQQERFRKFVEATRPGAQDSEYLDRLRELATAEHQTVQINGNGPVKANPKQLSQAEMDQLMAFRAMREQAQQIAKADKAAGEPRE